MEITLTCARWAYTLRIRWTIQSIVPLQGGKQSTTVAVLGKFPDQTVSIDTKLGIKEAKNLECNATQWTKERPGKDKSNNLVVNGASCRQERSSPSKLG